MPKKFDSPHQKIHSIAIKVKELEGQEDFDGAFEIVNQAKEGELAEMVRLFAEARSLLQQSHREIALVLDWQEKGMVVSVDSVESVEKISLSTIDDLPETFSTKRKLSLKKLPLRLKLPNSLQNLFRQPSQNIPLPRRKFLESGSLSPDRS